MIWFLGYIVIYALIAGWLYGNDREEWWFFFALFWPFIPVVAIIVGIGWIGYKANKFFSK
jgi:hypothetical protein